MDQVAYIDSTGLGILVALHVGARNQGATLKLSNLSARFHEILRITKLVKVFEVYNTEAVAVAS
jgi:anti-sigma B factor antagonist